jgi:hypothetical protein
LRASHGLKIILFGQLIAALWFASQMPLWERSDEMNHYRYAHFIARHGRLPTEADAPPVPAGYEIYVQYDQPPLYYLLLALPVALADDDAILHTTANPFPICAMPHDYFYLHTTAEAFPWRGTALAMWIGRLLTIGLGLAATTLVWLAGRWLAPENPRIALIAAAIFAWTPGFLEFTTWLNNDAPLMLGGALIVCGLVRGLKRLDGTAVTLLIIGTGAALLTKLSGLAVVPVVILFFLTRLARRWIIAIVFLVVIGAGVFSISNIARCGEPLCRLHRYTPHFASIETFVQTLIQPKIYQDAFYHLAQTATSPSAGDQKAALTWFSVMVGVPLFAGLLLSLRRITHPCRWLLLVVFCSLTVALVRIWWLQVGYFHVRYMAIALPAFALLVATGLCRLSFRLIGFWLGILWLVTMLIPVFYYQHIYAVPQPLTVLPNEATRIEPRMYGDQLRIDAFQFFPAETPARLRIYWQAVRPIAQPYFAMVNLVDREGNSIGQCGNIAGHPALTTVDWTPERRIAQDFVFSVDSGTMPAGFDVTVYGVRAVAYIVSTYNPDLILPAAKNALIYFN